MRRDGPELSEQFGALLTADHRILSEESESRMQHRHPVIVPDLFSHSVQSYPEKIKSSELMPLRRGVAWNHDISTPHLSETCGTAERTNCPTSQRGERHLFECKLDSQKDGATVRCNATATCVTCMILQQKDEQLVGADAMLLSVLLSHHSGLRSVTNRRTRIVSVDVESKCFRASSWDTPCVADWENTENHSLDHRHPRRKVQVTRSGGNHSARKLHLPKLLEPQRGRTRCPSTAPSQTTSRS